MSRADDVTIFSGPVEEYFTQPIPKEVWHYTNLAGFRGILSSSAIWATEAHFTTDDSEFVHALEVATDFLKSMTAKDSYQKRGIDTVLEIVTSAFDKGALSPDKSEVFVASFSATADLEGQWEQYADKARGVSLAFDLTAIRPPYDLNFAITFAPCLYAKADKEELIKGAVSHTIETVARLHWETEDHQWVAGQLKTWMMIQRIYGLEIDRAAFEANMQDKRDVQLREAHTRSLFDMLRVASHCKKESFSQEQEWRLALPHLRSKPLTHNVVLYRGPKNDIPYIATTLFQPTKALPVTRVMVGPRCKDQKEIQEILNAYGYSVPVVPSSIPPDQFASGVGTANESPAP